MALLVIFIGVFLILSFRFFGLPLAVVGLILIPIGYGVYHQRVSWPAFGVLFVLIGLVLIMGILPKASSQPLGIMGGVLGIAFIALGAIIVIRATRKRKAPVAKKNPKTWTAEE